MKRIHASGAVILLLSLTGLAAAAPPAHPIAHPELRPELTRATPELLQAVANGDVPVDYVLSDGLLVWTSLENLSDEGPRTSSRDEFLCDERLQVEKAAMLHRIKQAVEQAKAAGGMVCESKPLPRCHVPEPMEGPGAIDFIFRAGQENKLRAIVTRDEKLVPKTTQDRTWASAMAALDKTSKGCHPRDATVVVAASSCEHRGERVALRSDQLRQDGKSVVITGLEWGCGCATGPVWTMVYEKHSSGLRVRICKDQSKDRCGVLCGSALTFDVGAAMKATGATSLQLAP